MLSNAVVKGWPAPCAAGPCCRRALLRAAAQPDGASPTAAAAAAAPAPLGGLAIQPLELPRGSGSGGGDALGADPSSPTAAPLPAVPPVEEWPAHPELLAGCEPALNGGGANGGGRRLRVAVLVSGGVDSSVALRLVQAAGHEAAAFYLQIWFQEDFRNYWDACPWEEDLSYARAVRGYGSAGWLGWLAAVVVFVFCCGRRFAAGLSSPPCDPRCVRPPDLQVLITPAANNNLTATKTVAAKTKQVCAAAGAPLEVVPMTDAYWARVVAHSVGEIRAGRTPNPDVLCNSRVKFGAFCEWLDAARPGAFDRVASGHYARLARAPVIGGGGGGGGGGAQSSPQRQRQEQHQDLEQHHEQRRRVRLELTPDAVKDQTYFLAQLSPQQLARAMFPLGPLDKPRVRALAAAAGLANSGRKDSQGICFLGKVKFGEFVREHLGTWRGPLVEAETGSVLGAHDGYWFYTVGQRGGIRLPGGPWYVVSKDMRLNVVSVSRRYHAADKRRDALVAGPLNWLGAERPQLAAAAAAAAGEGAQAAAEEGRVQAPLLVKVRHGPHAARCAALIGTAAQVSAWARAAAALAAAADAGGGGGEDEGADGAAPAWRWRVADVVAAAGVGDGRVEPAAEEPAAEGQQQHQQGQQHHQQQYALVLLDERDQGLAAGQHAVLYQGGVCLGAAQILGALGSAEAAEALSLAVAAEQVAAEA